MSYKCKILLDSISPTNKRITTFEITFPRCVLAEAETHRVLRGFGGNVEELIINNLGINIDENLSRNSASSIAIPINRMLQRVIEDPFIPKKWGMPISGMGEKEYYDIDSLMHLELTKACIEQLEKTIEFVTKYKDDANKEDLNRYLEPFMWHTAILTATEWDNFFKLRTNYGADWKIKKIADLMYIAYTKDVPTELQKEWTYADGMSMSFNKFISGAIPEISYVAKTQKLNIGEWHCPLVYEEDDNLIHSYFNEYEDSDLALIEVKKKISVARCARVSYLTHDGKRDIEKDLELFEKLRTSGHWSPFEHVATPSPLNDKNERSGNFRGWCQFRKEFVDENCTNFRKE